jgi:hypothetical protein
MVRSTELESQIAGLDRHFRKSKSPFAKKAWVLQPVSADMVALTSSSPPQIKLQSLILHTALVMPIP